MYILPLTALECIYFTSVRSVLEYASPVIDNCTQQCCAMLEAVQYRAALCVTGAMKTSSKTKVLKCLGWPSLAVRRKYFMLVLYFKMINGLCPLHFRRSLLPAQNNEVHNYMLRNATARQIPRARTNVFAGSFVPSTTKLWNSLPPNIQDSNSINSFKANIKKLLFPARLDHLRYGPRKLNMTLNRLRVDFSALNAHLFTRQLIDTQACLCGFPSETTYHFLLQCPLFVIPRQDFLARISQILQTAQPLLIFDNLSNCEKTHICLYGHKDFLFDANCNILDATMKYIQVTKRFSKDLSETTEEGDQ